MLEIRKLMMLMIALMIFGRFSIDAQNQCPGITVVGRGYNIFGEYANNKSVKEQLFRLENYQNLPMDDAQEYKVPDVIKLKYINEKDIKITEGSSLRQYASSISAELGLAYDGFVFSGSVDSRFGKDKSSQTNNYFYTITDWTRVWEVYINPMKEDNLRQFLTPDAKTAIDTWTPEKLFEVFGTHYVSSGYFGGAMEYNLSEKYTSQSDAISVAVTVKAKYANVSGNTGMSYNKSEVNESFKSNIKIYARGGDVQYANNSAMGDNSQYNLWVNSIPTKAVLIDFKKGSLVPIWNLAANATRKAELENAFKKMLAMYPLPEGNAASIMMQNQLFYVKSVSESMYWDLNDFHYYAGTKGAKVQLYQKDVNPKGYQGADRFIKVISHSTKPEYVFFQPQHSDYVADITGGVKTPGAELQLWNKGEDNYAQMFKMIEVSGQSGTYYLENAASGLYLTANKGKAISQETKTGADNQKWVFEPANAETEMAPIPEEIFSFQNVKAKRYVDIPGSGAGAKGSNSYLQLWDMDNYPDRYMKINKSNIDNYYYIQPMHGTAVWDVEGGKNANGTKLQIYTPNNSVAQQFRFVYAGEPMTYYIINRNSEKAVDASDTHIGENGCPMQLWTLNKGDQQKWKLRMANCWQMPPQDQVFYIKSLYINKYIDLPGTGAETNANGKGFIMWDKDDGGDRKFKIIPTGDHSWVNIQAQNGGRYVAVPSNSKEDGVQIILYDKTGGNDQKFAIMFSSPTSFVIRTGNWKAIDIKGGSSDDWKQNGAHLIQYNPHYGPNQQFQLIYADGPKAGQVFRFIE
jgi:hypothetical protein